MTLRDFSEWAYERLVSDYCLVKDKLSLAQRISIIEAIYNYTWFIPFGRYADNRLEAELGKIFLSSNLGVINLPKPVPGKIVHIVSTLTGYGGHSRILYNWISNDKERKHSIIITRQNEAMPDWMKNDLDKLCEDVIIIGEEDLIQKVKRIIELMQIGYEAVILHHHPDDIIPVIAAFHPAFPPVAIYNHADHLMWPGVSIADIIINMRKTAEWYSEEYRGASRSFLFPFVMINKPNEKKLEKQETRKKLGIEKYRHIGITISSAYKLKPIYNENFYDTLYNFLIKRPDTLFYLIGPGNDDWVKYANHPVPENLIITGIIEHPNLYLSAADFYLQTFPLASGLATFDACGFDIVPVLYRDAPKIENMSEMIEYSKYLPDGMSMVYYGKNNFNDLQEILDNKAVYEQYLTAIKKSFNETNTNAQWNKYINDFYMAIKTIKHSTYPIDECKVERTKDAVYMNEALARSGRSIIYHLLHNKRYNWMSAKTRNMLKMKRNKYVFKDLIRMKFNDPTLI